MKDWKKYNSLQKHYDTLQKLYKDGDILDDIDWAICDSLNIKFEEADDLKKEFETIREYVEKAKELIVEESKTYL